MAASETNDFPADLLALAHPATSDYDAEFFFDPVCPWAWITSRWMTEAARVRSLSVHWNFISLKVINEGRQLDPAYAERAGRSHVRGLRLLRVAAAARSAHGVEVVHGVYSAFGSIIHVHKAGESLDHTAEVARALEEAGFDRSLADAVEDESWDAEIRASSALALHRTGKEVGTPIITYAPPDGNSLFGPVLSYAPKGDDAGELWDHLGFVARNPDFIELKRSMRGRPRFD
jgi:2-hydroxychromene-2-carboxylate isomerase